MAGKKSPQRTRKRASASLKSLASTLKAKAASFAKKTAGFGRKQPKRKAAPVSAASKSGSKLAKAPAAVKRISVVKKPTRQPDFRRLGQGRSLEAHSVVRKPARGPSRRPGRPSGEKASVKTPASQPAAEAIRPFEVNKSPVSSRTVYGQPSGAGQTAQSWQKEHPFSIPTGYGDNRLVLMVKDPWWLYAYWEIQPDVERAARAKLLPHEVAGLQSVLRVYDVTDRNFPAEPAHRWFDIRLSGLANNWYIHTNAPDRSFIIELGLLSNTGRFIPLVQSNRVTAPRFGPSDVIDEEWVITDEAYWKLFGGVSGLGLGSSQAGSAHLMMPYQLFSSGGWSSGSLYGLGKPSAVRGFWCRVNTDLVIHGAAEPKSAVSVQGQPVTVRKDGTFSLRLSLPEGTQTIDIEVTSPDGRKTKTVTPVVTLGWTGPIASGDSAHLKNPSSPSAEPAP